MKSKHFVLSVVLSILFLSCNSYKTLLRQNQSHSVTVRDSDSHVVAHLMVEKNQVHCKQKLTYYSFKTGKLFSTQGAINGTALHGTYREMYPSGELKLAGDFNQGLKVGTWKQWYLNGNLQRVEHYKQGKISKKPQIYALDGQLEKAPKVSQTKEKNDSSTCCLKRSKDRKVQENDSDSVQVARKIWNKITFKKQR